MAEQKIKRVEFLVDENNPQGGVKTISLVDNPAIESDFVFFNKQKPQYIELQEEGYKQVVAGLALIPDKDIIRFDEAGQPYYGYFTAETIENLRNKFHKELQNNKVNTDHEPDAYIDAFMIESFLVDSDERLADVQSKGIEEVKMGSWFVAYKIEDEETFQRVLDGELKGFSIEAFLDKTFSAVQANNNENNKFEKIMNNLIEKLQNLISEFAEEEATQEKFERGELEDGTIVDYTEVGSPVSIVTVSEEGEEEMSPAPEGEHILSDGRILVVDAEGMLVEIKEAEEEEAPAEEEGGSDEEVEASEENFSDADKKLSELIDLTQDGYFTVELMVENGAISFGNIWSNTFKELELKAEEKFAAEKKELEAKIAELKKAPIAEPVSNEDATVEVEPEVDLSKLTPIQRLAAQRGLKVPKAKVNGSWV